jgi:phage terminase large subunit-like protein
VTRFLEHESEFTKGEIFFEPEKNEELIDDVVVFPESEYKDVVDAMVF